MFTHVNPLQEIKQAKLQKQKMSATSLYHTDDIDREVLTIVEVILVDLVENTFPSFESQVYCCIHNLSSTISYYQ
jgi:hypothetical protein